MGKTGIGIKVESEYLPDVWVYGKYHNKISKEEYDKKIEEKNNPSVNEQKLSKLKIIQVLFSIQLTQLVKKTLRMFMYIINKRNIFFIITFFTYIRIFAMDISSLEGSWKPIRTPIDSEYYTINKYEFINEFGYKVNPYYYLVIKRDEKFINNGQFFLCAYNATNYIVNSTWIESESKMILECRYFNYEYNPISDDYQYVESNVINKYIILCIDENEIQIENFDGFQGWTKYYRISAPSKISEKKAVLNDSNVRLRVKPNLNSDIWAKLSKGTEVIIKDKSAEKYEIDGENWYWYKIDNPYYPDGWVYGKFLDIEE